MRKKQITIMLTILTLAATQSFASTVNPFSYFNVYSLNDIGSSTSAYHSDFQGIAGAAGSVYFSSFSLNGMDNQSSYTLHVGANATLTGSYAGDIEIGGNLSLANVSVNGNIHSGGSIANSSGGSTTGNVYAQTNINLSQQFSVGGNIYENFTYNPVVNHKFVSNYFSSTSAQIAGLSNTGSVSNEYGKLTLNTTSGINVVTISSQELNSAWGFDILGTQDSTVLINVTGTNASLNSTNWNYSGGITSSNVLINFTEATSLNLSGSNNVNILAANADVNFATGIVTGNLIAGDLQGGGQVNLGHFDNGGIFDPVPEPTTLSILAVGAMLIARRRHSIV